MATFQIPSPPPLLITDNTCGKNLSQNWQKFYQRFKNIEIATGIASKGDGAHISTLLSVIGQDALDTFNTFQFAEGDEKKFDEGVKQSENYCKSKKNTTYERYIFNCHVQKEGESLDTFVTALRTLAESCEFGDLRESIILDQIIIGITDKNMKQALLKSENLTLNRALTQIRVSAATNNQVEQMSAAQSAPVNTLRQSQGQRSSRHNHCHKQASKKNKAATP